MRSLQALALGLALTQSSSARVTNGATLEDRQVSTPNSGSVANWLGRLFHREAQITCFEDEYYEFVSQPTFGEQFCQEFMSYPAFTTTVVTSPVTTTTEVYSTITVTKQEVQYTTVVTTAATVTITPTPVAKRDASLDVNELFQGFRRQKGALNDTVIDTPQMSASFSSACDCQTYAGPTVTATQTDSAKVATVRAFEKITTTVVSVQTNGVITATATVTASATPTPTAPAFSCPEDNNSTVSQLIGNERFDYLVLCDTDLGDLDFYGVLSYNSFSECAAACSVADARFDSPVCQGFSYYSTNAAYNCFLKGTANQTVPAPGVDSAILQRIAVGLTEDVPAGTNTESAPFMGETQTLDPSQLSSSMSVIIANSSTSIPVITPGPAPIMVSGRPVNPGETVYSTTIIDGSTYSSGTVFSTYYSANGSWYYTYYTAFTQAWASETTVYASTETGTSISNTTDTETTTQAGNNGEYYTITVTNTTSYFPGGYNVTEVTANVTSASNGTQIASSAVTSYYSVATSNSGGGSGGGGGGGAGGIASSGAGNITATSVVSTFTVFSNGGQAGGGNGGGGSGVVQTPAPSVFVTSGGTAFSSGFAASGIITEGSGTPLSVLSTIVTIGGTAFSSGFAASGGGGGAGSASSTVASGATTSPNPLTAISSTIVVGGTAFSSGFAASGVVSDADSASSTTPSTGVVTPPGTLPVPISSTRNSTGTSGASSTAASGSIPFTNSNGIRSGTLSTSSPTSSPSASPSSGSPAVSSSSSSLSSSSRSGSSSVPRSSVPLSTTRSASTSLAGTPSTQSAPRPTGPVPYNYVPFTNSNGLRTNIPSGSSVPPGFVTASELISSGFFSSGTGFVLTGTAPTSALVSTATRAGVTQLIPYPTIGAVSSGFAFSSGFGLSGTAPTYIPSGFASTGVMPSSSRPSGTRPLSSTITASSGFPFTNSELPRTGTLRTSTGTSPASASPPYPTTGGATSCVPSYLGTTTIFSTVTEYGCYSNCPAQASAPLTFGPPSVETNRPGGY
ncbi:uncharacterized protein RCC_08526 [Ramularia collo-cygni]|uniref:Apple domain-containing protein n=1 Tax=Ramularia collo-cygni TaxID=112498 RepID=A0A2D3V7F1_9PEZI|nr:uncharacterized protein RCC_08526 [Ramularia collo-cygni]CZT22820.1 uncharacterized protein RCC_08526 [Ramularia collo-cygni]